MTAAGRLVVWRDRLLDRLSGVGPNDVLNGAPAPPERRDALRAAVDLKRAVNGLLDAADSAGAHLDYRRLAASPAYRQYRAESAAALRTADVATLSSRAAQLAFWINVYNALVIDAVIAFAIRGSVVEGRLGYLAFFRRAAYLVGGRRFSCDDIEHGVLRGNRGHPFIPGPQFGPADPRLTHVVRPPDVRIHFALNCGSRSCPPISAYEAADVDRQLDLAARSFVAGDVEVDASRGVARVSPIFKWFARDFGGSPGALALVRRYLPDDERRRGLEARGWRARLAYRPYDWRLNAAV